jgi:hypothetical protein
MIVIKLMGGLGNQMFQYALGRRLAHEHSVDLKLDLSWFRDARAIGVDTIREYALDGWRIQASVATQEDLSRYPVRAGLLARFGFARSTVVKEGRFGFDRNVLRVPSDVHLTGYWQSEKYFKSIRGMLLDEFMPAAAPCPHVTALVGSMRSRVAVSIHVRRGDYATDLRTRTFHGLCSPEYYREAVRRIADRVSDSTFFVFSDEPDWVRANLKLDHPTIYVTHEAGCTPHHEMWLMSQCTHHVIANSSFSWWGAWLCRNEEKIVIAPARWFADPSVDTRDLIPEGWLRI